MAASMAHQLFRGVGRQTNKIMAHGNGSWVTTVDGERLLDMTSGIGVTNTGHCHPKVVRAIQRQAETLIHAQVGVGMQDKMLELADRVLNITPAGLDRIFFPTTGAEAVENAIKLARRATGKPNIIVFQGGYHGRSFGTMPLTTSKATFRMEFGPFMPGIVVAPFPNSMNLPAVPPDALVGHCIEQLQMILRQQSTPAETCCVLIEPVLGEGGYVPAPPDFISELRRICNETGILLVADEVQSGFGRTGKMFAIDGHYGVDPDILIMAKGLASGMPISAVAAKSELTELQDPGTMGGTYAGNIVGCAAALATLDVFAEENLVENAAVMGDRLLAGLLRLQSNSEYQIRNVRGLGCMIGVEFEPEAPVGTAGAVATACADQGMLLLTTSAFECVRFIPPLTVAADEIDIALDRFKAALDSVSLNR